MLLRGLIDAGDYKQLHLPAGLPQADLRCVRRGARRRAGGLRRRRAWPTCRKTTASRSPTARTGTTSAASPVTSAQRSLTPCGPSSPPTPTPLPASSATPIGTNKDLLPDSRLADLIEHFSTKTLSVANLPEDELGNGYEYLIKKFADDSGHTAQEFYTNRTLVHLMTLMLEPQPGESVYDPTCGTGGMLISAAAELKRQGKEWRNLRLYGQELNYGTSAIARMNLFLHGITDGHIAHGDTLARPAFLDSKGRLQTFDVVLANPPYSIKAWNRAAFAKDPYGRNTWGVPPQSRADYAFIQHIAKTLAPTTGRAAVLLPHGVLDRLSEADVRARMVESGLVEAVIGMAPGLFYNSGMEAVVLVLRSLKTKERQGKVLFINAKEQYIRVQAQSFLSPENQSAILNAYRAFGDTEGFAKVVTTEQIADKGYSLAISQYVRSSVAPDRSHGRIDKGRGGGLASGCRVIGRCHR